jgi:hypothetical protein
MRIVWKDSMNNEYKPLKYREQIIGKKNRIG